MSYEEYAAYKEAIRQMEADSPKSYQKQMEELTYRRGYLQGRIDVLKEQLGVGE